jgi:glutamate-1-semialdehyde 2,1-aminomutase
MPGGVNSPVRALRGVGAPHPLFIARGRGAHTWDADGNEYIDLVSSWGPMIVGWCHPHVRAALHAVVDEGTSFGAPTEREVRLAELLCEALPSVEMVRMVSSGTEATMSALRLARAFTGRHAVVKFAGCYHGHADPFLVQAGSGVLTLGLPDSPGVTPGGTGDTLVLEYNDVEGLRDLFAARGDEIACLIMEPAAANMGVVLPEPGFLEAARGLCTSSGALLVFDEIITGFRVGWSGAQGRYGVMPDLTTVGKIVGGGLPAAAFGGRRDIMEHLAPSGPVYHAGTLNGNPLAMAAGLATLEVLREPGVYDRLEDLGAQLEAAVTAAAAAAGAPLTVNRVGAMFTAFLCEGPVRSFADARAADTQRYAVYWRAMLERGVYAAPSQFEAVMVSLALTDDDVAAVGAAAAAALADAARGGAG